MKYFILVFQKSCSNKAAYLNLSNYLRLDQLLMEDIFCCNRTAIYSQILQMIFALFKYLFYFGGDISSQRQITVEIHSLRGAETARTHFTKLS